MYRTARHIEKNDGQHNYFGEEEYINDKDGTVITEIDDHDRTSGEEDNEE